jgi:N-acetylneuraminate synthase
MSTGMHTIEELKGSVEILEHHGIQHALLECTNLYPSPPQDVSLKGIVDLQREFQNSLVGFSDHSIGPAMCIAAVALGAVIIERHFTDSRYRKGPDIICSMDPVELKYLIDRSKEVFSAINNEKQRTSAEEEVYAFARASIVADKDLPNGHTISSGDIWGRRPGNGEISIEDFEKLIGMKTKRKINKNTQIKWSDLEGDM